LQRLFLFSVMWHREPQGRVHELETSSSEVITFHRLSGKRKARGLKGESCRMECFFQHSILHDIVEEKAGGKELLH
jgi:hypothetical protein